MCRGEIDHMRGKCWIFQSSALPIELPSRLTREKIRKNNQLHNYGTMTTPRHEIPGCRSRASSAPANEEIIIVILRVNYKYLDELRYPEMLAPHKSYPALGHAGGALSCFLCVPGNKSANLAQRFSENWRKSCREAAHAGKRYLQQFREALSDQRGWKSRCPAFDCIQRLDAEPRHAQRRHNCPGAR